MTTIAQPELLLHLVHIIARERQGLLVFCQLQLEHHQVLIEERRLRAGEVHFPHSAEALAEPFRRNMPGGAETLAPVTEGRRIMEPQDLEVGDDQSLPLDWREHLAQGRAVAARKDVFADEGIGRRRPVEAADRMEYGHAVIGEELADLLEEGAIVSDADMLEHADRHDAIEFAFEIAIVTQLELYRPRKTHGAGALLRDRELLLAQGNARHLDMGGLGEVKREPSPSRADIEDF